MTSTHYPHLLQPLDLGHPVSLGQGLCQGPALAKVEVVEHGAVLPAPGLQDLGVVGQGLVEDVHEGGDS